MNKPLNNNSLTLFKGVILGMLFLAFANMASAQGRLQTPIRLKIDHGNTDDVSVVLKNLTTGETNSVNGEQKFSLSLKLNCDYIISFNKPGYVTKKIQVNTRIPEERAKQGLYPFPFDVYLFKQYEGVNIVVFNQPVGKIAYYKDMDDFDYDTDYTKQMHSLFEEAEEASKEMAVKEEAKSKEEEKEAARLKKVADEEAKAAAKLKAAEDKKALAANKVAEDERKKLAKKENQELPEQTKPDVMAENRAKGKKGTATDDLSTKSGIADADNMQKVMKAAGGDESLAKRKAGGGEDQLVVVSQAVSEQDLAPPGGYMGAGKDERVISKASGMEFQDPSPEKATAYVFQDARQGKSLNGNVSDTNRDLNAFPEKKVEEISEFNRVITRVTIKTSTVADVYRRVSYNWGGVYFFKNDRPISESLYNMATAQR